jgi:hypothetical protein
MTDRRLKAFALRLGCDPVMLFMPDGRWCNFGCDFGLGLTIDEDSERYVG